MKIEDCTKEELIWYIKTQVSYDERELLFQVLLHRSGEVSKSAAQADEKACKALERYTDALRPYEGCSYMDVPSAVTLRSIRDYKEFEKYTAVASRYRRQYEQIHKQIDKFL